MEQHVFDDAIAMEREAATADLDAIAGDLGRAGIGATTVVVPGTPANRLLDSLEEMPQDLVVLASHGRTGIKR